METLVSDPGSGGASPSQRMALQSNIHKSAMHRYLCKGCILRLWVVLQAEGAMLSETPWEPRQLLTRPNCKLQLLTSSARGIGA